MSNSAEFDRLFADHAGALVLYARQWLDRSLAEDVVQETFVRLLARLPTPSHPKAWLYRAVRNAAISQNRSQSRRQRREQKTSSDEAWFDTATSDWLDGLEAKDALESLPASQREVIVLRIWGQMSLKEIAAITQSSTSTVFDHYRAGLRKLRERFGVPCTNHD
jgi:RNA polymerase sigma factor (sigma-70 family)